MTVAHFMDRWLVYPKLAYMTMSMSLYATYVFTPAYFESVWGVPTHGYGYISSMCVLSLGGSVIWSRLGEKMKKQKLMLMICGTLYAALFGMLWSEIGAKSTNQLTRMTIVTIFYGGSSAFGGAISPILDNIILEFLTASSCGYSKDLYGRQRLWSSIGHAIIVVINGWGIQTFGYNSMFICLIVSTLAFLFTLGALSVVVTPPSTTIINYKAEEKDNTTDNAEINRIEESTCSIWTLLKNPAFVLFCSGILIAGYVRCVVGAFGPVYFKKVLQMKEATYALAMQTRLVPELLCFFFGKEITQKYGNTTLMMFGQGAGILRSAIYGIVPQGPAYAWVTYPAEMLKGINNAGIMMAGPRMAHDYAPPGSGATALAIFHGIYSSLAMILAGIAGGQILKTMGDQANGFKHLFLVTAASGLIPIIALIFLKLWRVRPQ